MKFKKLILVLMLFLLTLFLIYILHVNFLRVDVVFYSAIFDSIVAALLVYLIICMASFFSIFNNFERFQIFSICLLIGYSFAISVPTIIDRSLSFYILEKIDQRGGGILLSGFEDVFTKEYMLEHRLVDVRITEQLSSGTIELENDCVKITEKGKWLTIFSRYFRKNLLPKQRLLMGEYSSDLTDPFAHGALKDDYVFDYACK